MQFKKIAKNLGFTQTEFNVLIFLISAFVLGTGIKYFKVKNNSAEYKNFSYAASDSQFVAKNNNSNEKLIDSADKKFDYKREVLDFSDNNFRKQEKEPLPAEKSINVNKAGISELSKLPGIGEKTAQKIIELRNSKNGFKKVNDLLEVKGIGNSKLEKIKKYITLD